MGKIRSSIPVKLIIGFIYKERDFEALSKKILQNKFGSIDYETEELDFNYTDYYKEEFGENLKRKIISFKKLINLKNIEKIKLYTNKIEKKFLQNNKRRINIDPGYLTDAKLILFTTKDFSHRVYLGRGIYADLTLFFKKGSFEGLEWTYPDYKTGYINIFNDIRKLYLNDTKNLRTRRS